MFFNLSFWISPLPVLKWEEDRFNNFKLVTVLIDFCFHFMIYDHETGIADESVSTYFQGGSFFWIYLFI